MVTGQFSAKARQQEKQLATVTHNSLSRIYEDLTLQIQAAAITMSLLVPCMSVQSVHTLIAL